MAVTAAIFNAIAAASGVFGKTRAQQQHQSTHQQYKKKQQNKENQQRSPLENNHRQKERGH